MEENFITVAWQAAADKALPITKISQGRLDWTFKNINRPTKSEVDVWLVYSGGVEELRNRLEVLIELRVSDDSPNWKVISSKLVLKELAPEH